MYSKAIINEEDFIKERAKRDNELLTRLGKKLNGRWLATINGFDVDYNSVAAPGQDE